MDTPAEITFAQLLFTGVGLLLLVGGALVVFLVTYQKRLLRQQLRLTAAEAEHQQQLLAAVIAAQEAERERIGRDLHDDVASSVAMARMLVNRLVTEPGAEDSPAVLALAHDVLGSAVEEVRSVSHSLYPVVLARAGLAKSLEYLAEICRRAETMAVELAVDYPHPLPLPQELALYRICQELVHNALKHASGATCLCIELRQSGAQLVLTVADDGCGFAPDGGGPPHAGVGLRSISVRVQLLQARFYQHSAPGQGTRTRIELDAPVPTP